MAIKQISIDGAIHTVYARKVNKRSKDWQGYWLDKMGVSHGPVRVFDSDTAALLWAELDLRDAINREKK